VLNLAQATLQMMPATMFVPSSGRRHPPAAPRPAEGTPNPSHSPDLALEDLDLEGARHSDVVLCPPSKKAAFLSHTDKEASVSSG